MALPEKFTSIHPNFIETGITGLTGVRFFNLDHAGQADNALHLIFKNLGEKHTGENKLLFIDPIITVINNPKLNAGRSIIETAKNKAKYNAPLVGGQIVINPMSEANLHNHKPNHGGSVVEAWDMILVGSEIMPNQTGSLPICAARGTLVLEQKGIESYTLIIGRASIFHGGGIKIPEKTIHQLSKLTNNPDKYWGILNDVFPKRNKTNS